MPQGKYHHHPWHQDCPGPVNRPPTYAFTSSFIGGQLLDLDNLDAMDDDDDIPLANKLILNEKEAHEEPKLLLDPLNF